jgi:hypothetical protein
VLSPEFGKLKLNALPMERGGQHFAGSRSTEST